MFGLGTQELIVIALVVLIFFGAKRIPELMRSMGQGVKEFKKATKEISDDMSADSTPERPKTSSSSNNNHSPAAAPSGQATREIPAEQKKA